MAKRSKQIVWHKKKQKMISSTLLKPHAHVSAKDQQETASAPTDRKRAFVQDLSRKIRQAVQSKDG